MLEIPSKTYFKIGEAAKLLDLKPYIIRYWESEFRQLRLSKTSSGQRLFTREDIELLYLIRTLLYDRKYTVAGAVSRITEIRDAGVSYGDFVSSLENGDLAIPGDEASSASDAELRERVSELSSQLARLQSELEKSAEESKSLHQWLKEERLVSARAQRDSRQLREVVRKLHDSLTELHEMSIAPLESERR